MVVHGDFAEWNVHYERGRLAGVIDFGLTHLDSRPYELAIARTYRAPETVGAYRAELARRGWPLSHLEKAALEPVYRAFRLDMAVWFMAGLRTGGYDLAMIERQLARTGAPAPLPVRPEPAVSAEPSVRGSSSSAAGIFCVDLRPGALTWVVVAAAGSGACWRAAVRGTWAWLRA